MRSLKAKLKKQSPNGNKEEWSKVDQRIWHSVSINQPAKLASKFSKYPNINVNKLYPSVGYSVVHFAAAKGLDDCLNVLLAHNANCSNRDITGATPLHASARYGQKGTTNKLLATCTVDVNSKDNNQCTALHFASFEGHLDCVKLIANFKGCNIHCVDQDGRTALMVAAAMGRLNVCQYLIEQGVDVNHKDSSPSQHCALTLAAEAGHADVVKLLCNSGADYNAKLSDGRSTLEVARGHSKRSVVDALHVIQLTQAARKTDKGDSGRNSHVDKSEAKKRFGNRTEVNEEHPSNSVKKSLKQQNNSNHDELDRDSPSYPSGAEMLPLYNESKHGQLYDRDVSLYDSKSTLASMSSLDASSIIDTSKVSHNESHSTPLPHSADIRSKNSSKLCEELALKEEQMIELEKRFHESVSTSKREIECLKNSNDKYEQTVQELEKANDRLSKDCLKFQQEKNEALQHLDKIQGSNEKMKSAFKKSELAAQQNLAAFEEKLNMSTYEIAKLTKEKNILMTDWEREKQKLNSVQSELDNLLLSAGLSNNDDSTDLIQSLQLLQAHLFQTLEKNAKKSEEQKLIRNEINLLQDQISKQEELIRSLKSKLIESEQEIQTVKKENYSTAESNRSLQERLLKSEQVNKQQVNTIEKLQQNIVNLQQTLDEQLHDSKAQLLEEKLQMSYADCERLAEEHESEQLKWKETERDLRNQLKEAYLKRDKALKDCAEMDQFINSLRSQRNEREELLARSKKILQISDGRRKDAEVELNRTRQQLTEANQKCTNLEHELSNLRQTNRELSSKLNAVKLYNYSEADRMKVDSMKIQVEKLFTELQESEQHFNQVISVYRGHLLKAAKGELDLDVLLPLREILKLVDKPQAQK